MQIGANDIQRKLAEALLRRPIRAYRIAILLPCYNEEGAIGAVVRRFAEALPGALIYVCDNASTDGTAREALTAGAHVLHEGRRGKGNAVRRLFAEVDADIYLMADGDGSYDAASAPLVEKLLSENLDMVVAARAAGADAFRSGHYLGNRLFNKAVSVLFGEGFTDIFSGYRAFSRRFAKSFPAMSQGFEIESELTIYALDLRMPTAEIAVPFGERAVGTTSKLKTISDGLRIALAIQSAYRQVSPMRFFAVFFVLFSLGAAYLGAPIVAEFFETGLVPRLPTAILAASLGQLAAMALALGIITEAVAKGRRESKRLMYLILTSFAAARPEQRGEAPQAPWLAPHAEYGR